MVYCYYAQLFFRPHLNFGLLFFITASKATVAFLETTVRALRHSVRFAMLL